MATREQVRKAYPTDLTDEQWEMLEPCISPAKPGGRPRATDVREVLNALFYLERTGGAWRMLPHEFPPWETVYTYFRNWKRDGTWDEIHDTLHRSVRLLSGRNEEPSAAIIDSQSVKTAEKGGRGAMTRARRSRVASGT
jgi:putative transposase